MVWFHLLEVPTAVRLLETQSGMEDARGWGSGKGGVV